MSSATEQLTVVLQEREFRIKCPADRKEELLWAVKRLDYLIDRLRTPSRFITLEQMVILVALNLICQGETERAHCAQLTGQLQTLQEHCVHLTSQLVQLNEKLAKVLRLEGAAKFKRLDEKSEY